MVVVPSSSEFFAYNTTVANVTDLELRIEGTWTARDDIQNWPNTTDNKKPVRLPWQHLRHWFPFWPALAHLGIPLAWLQSGLH